VSSRPLLPEQYLDVNLSNFVIEPEGGLRFIDTEWHAAGGVDAEIVCTRALWSFAYDLVVRGIAHLWPRSSTVSEITESLGLLCASPSTSERVLQMLRSESELQAKVLGKDTSELFDSLRAANAASQLDPDRIRHLPLTALRYQAVAANLESQQARRELAVLHRTTEDLQRQLDGAAQGLTTLTKDVRSLTDDVDARETTIAAAHGALRREAEANAALRTAIAHRDEELAARDLELSVLREQWSALEQRRVVRFYRKMQRVTKRGK